ncbi:MAG: acyl carrier protein [Candidatus Accumulibacter sp.]|jgi:acyl carrier protein|nr:acyl carrier protein [Accumulibacter sp.]
MTDEQILEKIRKILSESFEIDPAVVSMETRLFEDIDLDSIDAVDLAIKIQEITGKRIKPEDFRDIRSVRDVVLAVKRLLAVSA